MPAPGSLSALVAPAAGLAPGRLQIAFLVVVVPAGVVLWMTLAGIGLLGLVISVALVTGLARQRNNHGS